MQALVTALKEGIEDVRAAAGVQGLSCHAGRVIGLHNRVLCQIEAGWSKAQLADFWLQYEAETDEEMELLDVVLQYVA